MSHSPRFLLLFTLFYILSLTESDACLIEYPTHNYYMLSYVNRDYDTDIFHDDISAFWRDYTNGEYEEYPLYDITGLEDFISSRNDDEMLEYVHNLNSYLDICNDINYWDYPSEEDLAERSATLSSLKEKSSSYTGSRLRSQYSLLYMRCNMLMNDWDEVKRYWETTGRKLPDNVFRSMMENIYAGSLYRSGDIAGASSIYFRQGDEESVRWSLNKYRNIHGIRSIYDMDANSPLLPYLIEEYVNTIQETLDNIDPNSYQSGFQRILISLESISFYQLTKEVLLSGKSNNPCMWATASAMLQYLNGNYSEAQSTSNYSLSLEGTERIKANSRCVNILINSSDSTCDRQWLTKELHWLAGKVHEENSDGYCYSNAYERILMKSLVPLYSSTNQMSLSLAVAGLYNELLVRNNEYHSRFPLQNPDLHPSSWNDDYDNEYMQHFVYPLSASECLSYYNYLTSHHSDDLEEYICSEVYKDSNFFNDLIGTKYISEGKFAEAIPYLEKVDLSYLSKLNTSDYMYNRDFTKARWFVLQRSKNDLEGISKKSFTQNPKIIYCRSMLDLENKFAKMKQSDAKYAIAYQLACQYYQASYKGECWWLTSYYNSSSYERVLYSYNMDFIEKSKEYLTYCLSSTDPDMKSKCLYALAYIPTDIWAESVTDYDDNGRLITTYMNPNPESSQYQYLSMLNTYYNSHKDEVPSYISKCDVLKQFRKLEWYSE